MEGETKLAYSRGGCLLQDLLDKADLTQAEYARRSFRDKRVISHFCNSERAMLPEDIYTASMILGCRMEDLYEWIEIPEPEWVGRGNIPPLLRYFGSNLLSFKPLKSFNLVKKSHQSMVIRTRPFGNWLAYGYIIHLAPVVLRHRLSPTLPFSLWTM
jgi:hypothetical protein